MYKTVHIYMFAFAFNVIINGLKFKTKMFDISITTIYLLFHLYTAEYITAHMKKITLNSKLNISYNILIRLYTFEYLILK